MTVEEGQDDPRAAWVARAFEQRELLREEVCRTAILSTIADLDAGRLRAASPPSATGQDWTVHGWIQQAVLLYFALAPLESSQAGPFTYCDRIPLKENLPRAHVRAVPGSIVRYGAHLEAGVVVMPSFVNIGARVGSGTMIDTWATVGSCAQVGRNVHLSGGAGIGGVLEPPGARPVIVEDECFIGSRAILVEGVRVGRGAVLGANVVLTATTHIIDVRGHTPETTKGEVPSQAVVVPGTRPREFPAGEFNLPCALIIGERNARTDSKTSLNQVLRDFPL